MDVVLFSGGYDSTVLTEFLKSHNLDVKLYHTIIKDKRNNIINNAETTQVLVQQDIYPIEFWGGIVVEKVGEYVPCRNSLLVMECANTLAHIEGEHTIYLGLIKNAEPFPDCTVDWVETMNELLYVEFGGTIKVVAPFVELYKDFVYQIGNTLGVDINKTYSCNYENSKGEPCGVCGECEWRKGKETLKTYVNKKEWRDFNAQFEQYLENRI